MKKATIVLNKEDMKFCSGHFTIFSASERERLHGHNFFVRISVDTWIQDNGMAFNYDEMKRRVVSLCQGLNEYFLLPGNSPHLKIKHVSDKVLASFNGEELSFLKKDVLVLPLVNISLEELGSWFIDQIRSDKTQFDAWRIERLCISVYSEPGQCVASTWQRDPKAAY